MVSAITQGVGEMDCAALRLIAVRLKQIFNIEEMGSGTKMVDGELVSVPLIKQGS